jgi:hypothetical protein
VLVLPPLRSNSCQMCTGALPISVTPPYSHSLMSGRGWGEGREGCRRAAANAVGDLFSMLLQQPTWSNSSKCHIAGAESPRGPMGWLCMHSCNFTEAAGMARLLLLLLWATVLPRQPRSSACLSLALTHRTAKQHLGQTPTRCYCCCCCAACAGWPHVIVDGVTHSHVDARVQQVGGVLGKAQHMTAASHVKKVQAQTCSCRCSEATLAVQSLDVAA